MGKQFNKKRIIGKQEAFAEQNRVVPHDKVYSIQHVVQLAPRDSLAHWKIDGLKLVHTANIFQLYFGCHIQLFRVLEASFTKTNSQILRSSTRRLFATASN